jgi:hypothetical protein
MPSVVYAYDVNQIVWCVDVTYGVHKAVIKTVDIESNTVNVSPVIKYSVVYTNPTMSSNLLTEDKVFSDIDNALASYKQLILAL